MTAQPSRPVKLLWLTFACMACVACEPSATQKQRSAEILERDRRAANLCFEVGAIPVYSGWNGLVIDCKPVKSETH